MSRYAVRLVRVVCCGLLSALYNGQEQDKCGQDSTYVASFLQGKEARTTMPSAGMLISDIRTDSYKCAAVIDMP